ncbi:MAG: RDD family protein [Rhizobiaceae bacterium]|nr:RDD family protein [Rhizobiaceae bacterium]
MNTDVVTTATPLMLDDPRALDGVLLRRMMAFVIDYIIVGAIVFAVAVAFVLLGIVTLGAGFLLFFIFGPIVLLIALTYVWRTLGGPDQATIGMKVMGIRIWRMDGSPIDGMTAVVHSILFWAGNSIMTPLILLATLFTDYKRTVHDLLLGTVVTRDRI